MKNCNTNESVKLKNITMIDDIHSKALEWINAGNQVAIATVIATNGSSPRPVGSQMVAADNGAFEGSISGGCAEGAVVAEALDMIGHGQCRRFTFDINQNQFQPVRLTCGGEIEIFLEKVSDATWIKELVELKRAGQGACICTDLETGHKTVVPLEENDNDSEHGSQFIEAVDRLRNNEKNFILKFADCTCFFQAIHPPLQMIVVGAVHIAQQLTAMARAHGYIVTLIDPRNDFATENRFPDITTIEAWPTDAMKRFRLHKRTAIVILSHDPKLDDPAIKTALESNAFYVGALGSKKTHAARRQRLQEDGFSEKTLDRISGPVGLSIGALTPEEIAVSIMAEIIQKKRVVN